MDTNRELWDARAVGLDIETEVVGDKPSVDDIPKFIGFRQADGQKVMYHISRRTKIQQALSYFQVYTGHNIEEYDLPILTKAGFNLTNDRGWSKPTIDTFKIFEKRAKPMMYLDLSMAQLSLRSLAERYELMTQKGDIDYRIFHKNSWTPEETMEIKHYLYGDLDTAWDLLVWCYEFFYGFKGYMSPKSQRLFHWLRSSAGATTYKIICHKSGIKEVYGQGDDVDEVGYEGAFVALPYKDQVKGDMYCVDFASLYPHMFMGGNLYSLYGKTEDLGRIPVSEIGNYWQGGNIFKSQLDGQQDGLGGIYTREMGKIENTINDLYHDRLKYKAKMKNFEEGTAEYKKYDALQLATKIVINTAYGISGSPLFENVYDLTTASDCTAMARMAIKHARKRLTEAGYECMYTDSVLGDTEIVFYHNNMLHEMPFRKFKQYVIDEVQCTPSFQDGKMRYFFNEQVLTPTMGDDLEVFWGEMKYLMCHHTDKQCYEIEHVSGKVSVTEDHSLITAEWKTKETADLIETKPTEATTVILNDGFGVIPDKRSMATDRDLLRFCGLFAMRGKKITNRYEKYRLHIKMPKTKNGDVYTNIVMENCVKPVLNKYGGRAHLLDDYTIEIASPRLRTEIDSLFNREKRTTVPQWMYTLPDDKIMNVLSGVHAAIGFKRPNGVSFYSTKRWVVKQIDRLFKTIGVWGTLTKQHKGWLLMLPLKYTEWFKKALVPVNAYRMGESPQTTQRKPIRESSVQCITPLPRENREVFDVEVADTHRFFANDVLVHNTDSVYILDPFHDREKVERTCERISEEQRLDMNVYIDTHSLEVETYIHHMYFFRNDKGDYVKKFYAYIVDGKKEGELKVKLKGIKLVKGDCSALAKQVYKKYIEQDLKDFKEAQYSPEQVFEWVKELFQEDPDQLSKRFRPKNPSKYKRGPNGEGPTSIHYNIAMHYGEGEFHLVPNTVMGIGKGKKYALKEELVAEMGDGWIDSVLLFPIVEELKVFIPWQDRKRIKNLQKSETVAYFVDTKADPNTDPLGYKHLVKCDVPYLIGRYRNQSRFCEIPRKEWLAYRRRFKLEGQVEVK